MVGRFAGGRSIADEENYHLRRNRKMGGSNQFVWIFNRDSCRKVDMAYRPPAPLQNFAQSAVRIQRFRYEKVAGLQLRGEEQPCWIFYWNPVPGMLLSVGGKETLLDPAFGYLLAPRTCFDLRLQKPKTPAPDDGFFASMSPIGAREDVGRLVREGLHPYFFATFSLDAPGNRAHPGVYPVALDRELLAMIDQATETLRANEGQSLFDQPSTFLFESLLLALLARLPPTVWPERPMDARVARALRFIHEHLGDRLDAHSLAAAAGLSPNRFSRLFKRETGREPRAAVRRERIDRARQLLADSRLSIEEVADECGFCDRYYFSRVFREETEFTPAAYRQRAI